MGRLSFGGNTMSRLKKIWLLVAAAAVFHASAFSVSAETLNTLQVALFPGDAHYAPYTQAHPQVVLVSDNAWHNTTEERLHALKTASPAYDLFRLSTTFYDGKRVMAEGLCADLSGSTILTEAVGRMWQPIQDAVTHQGKLYAVPYAIMHSWLSWSKEAWQAAGLEGTPPPASYTELLDFLDGWAERIKIKPEPDIRVNNAFDETLYNQYSYVRWLLPILMDCYTMPHRVMGTSPRFDTPEFRALLDRTEKTGRALYAAEKPRAKARLQLINSTALGYNMWDFSGGYGQGIPLRITADQPAVFKASLDLLCVGQGCAQPELALSYLEQVVTHMQENARTYAFRDSQPLKKEGQGYLISPGQLADYKAFANQLFFPAPDAYNLVSPEGHKAFQLLIDFSEGKLSADQLVRSLDAL